MKFIVGSKICKFVTLTSRKDRNKFVNSLEMITNDKNSNYSKELFFFKLFYLIS